MKNLKEFERLVKKTKVNGNLKSTMKNEELFKFDNFVLTREQIETLIAYNNATDNEGGKVVRVDIYDDEYILHINVCDTNIGVRIFIKEEMFR